jgi:hypothetical protein
MSSNGRASLCLGSKQNAKGIIPNEAPNPACTRSSAKCAGAMVVRVAAFSTSCLAQAAEDNKEQFFGIIRLA